MSIVRWPGLVPRQSRAAAWTNGLFDTIGGADSIDAPNFAEEGIDRPALDLNIQAEPLFLTQSVIQGGEVINTATGSTWTTLEVDGVPIRSSVGADIGANDVVLVRGLVRFVSSSVALGVDEDTDFRARIVFSDGTTHAISGTLRIAHNGTFAAGMAGSLDGRISLAGALAGPRTADWFEIQYTLNPVVAAACSVNIQAAQIAATIYRKVL